MNSQQVYGMGGNIGGGFGTNPANSYNMGVSSRTISNHFDSKEGSQKQLLGKQMYSKNLPNAKSQ